MQLNKLQVFLSFLLLSLLSVSVQAKDGYTIKAHFTDVLKETKIYLATCMLKLNRTEELFELAEELDRGRGRNQDAQVFFIVANAAYEQENYAKSAQYFKTYLDKRGELSRGGYFRYAQSYYKTKKYDAAIPVYQKAISRERDTLTQIASYYLGFCFLEKGEKENARAAFEIAAKTPEPSNRQ